ncbi:hypothetical protein BOX15_Mlig034476g3, partial [Macrostomum lignano]
PVGPRQSRMSGRSSAASQSQDSSSRFYQSPRDKKLLCVSLVSGENVFLSYDKRTTIGEIFDKVCEQKDIRESSMFGIAVRMHSFYLFLRHETRVDRVKFKDLLKKNSAFHSRLGSGKGKRQAAASNGDLTAIDPNEASAASYEQYTNNRVYFRVKFYVRTNALPEKAAKMYYYLQIRENVLRYNMLLNESTIFQLIAFSLQADYGSYRTDLGTAKEPYFNVQKYCPLWLIERYGADWLLQHLPTQHASLELMTQSEAVFRYIRLASEMQNIAHNQHIVKVTEKGPANNDGSLFLGIGPVGISLYEPRNLIHVFMVHASTLPWADIVRLRCQRKRLEILPKGGRPLLMGFSTTTQAEYTLWLCKELHRYQLLSQMYASSTRRAVEADEMTPHQEMLVVPGRRISSQTGAAATAAARPSASVGLEQSDESFHLYLNQTRQAASVEEEAAAEGNGDDAGFGYGYGYDFGYGYGYGVSDTGVEVAEIAFQQQQQQQQLQQSQKQQLESAERLQQQQAISASLPLLPEVAALKDRLRLRGGGGGGGGSSGEFLNLSLPLLTGLLSSQEAGGSIADSSSSGAATGGVGGDTAASVQRHHSSVEPVSMHAGLQQQHLRKQAYVNLGATVDDLSLLSSA